MRWEVVADWHHTKTDSFGDVFYYNEEGKLHRIDAPAIEHSCGTRSWFVNGKRHRAGGPALEHCNGRTVWYCNGKLHRLDGPAIEDEKGYQEYWIDGVYMSRDLFLGRVHQ